MAKILCVWELGEDLGHLAQFSVVSKELLSRGHEVYFAARDLSRSDSFFPEQQVCLLQAPVWQPRLKKPMKTRTFSEILLYQGFQSKASLQPLVSAWRNLFTLISPDLVIFDYAPAALVAAINFSFKKVILSNSFTTLPVGSDSKDLQSWESDPTYDLTRSEFYITNVINEVLANYDTPEIGKISDIFRSDLVMLTCFRDIDFYRSHRHQAVYIGCLPGVSQFKAPSWAASVHPKVFAYLKYGKDKVAMVINVLQRLPVNALCFYAGASREECIALSRDAFRVSNEPFNIDAVLNEAGYVVTHAGMGIVNQALYHGCPMLVVPTQLEQINTAILLEEMQVALSVKSRDTETDIEEKIISLIQNFKYLRCASEFSVNNELLSPQKSLKVVGDLCEDLLQ